jgi:triosephosphate isomerase
MGRRTVVIGNWKMHKSVSEATEFALDFKKRLPELEGVDIGLAAGGPLLPTLAARLQGTGVQILGQNLHWEEQGAFTGETSATMLSSAGCTGVLIGHSERRQYFGETDETVARKVQRALAASLQPVICVGETLEERKAGQTSEVVERQTRAALEGLSEDQVQRCILAYEPVWAIGTGETATPDQAQEVHHFLRGRIAETVGRVAAESLRIQYGGSVKPANAAELFGMDDIDGGLIGGAALTVDSFAAICQAG